MELKNENEKIPNMQEEKSDNDQLSNPEKEQAKEENNKQLSKKQIVMKAVGKQLIIYGAIAYAIFFFFRGYDFYLDCHNTIDRFVIALNDQDIAMLDQVLDPYCEMWTTDGKIRSYSVQRKIILENWDGVDYEITSVDYKLFASGPSGIVKHWIFSGVAYLVIMELIDDAGNEYELTVIMDISRSSSPARITCTHTSVSRARN